jgi:glucose/arabinose dehydrogenase
MAIPAEDTISQARDTEPGSPPMTRPNRNIAMAAALCLLTACTTGPSEAQVFRSEDHQFRVQTVADGLAYPWSLAFLPDRTMLVTERDGNLWLLSPDGTNRSRISGLPEVADLGQGGLLDVLPHPDVANNGWIYLSYSRPGPGGQATAIGRGRLDGTTLRDFDVLYTAEPYASGGRHFGSRMVWGRDGHLYVTSGERGSPDRAQDRRDPAGSVLRLTEDGRVPADNPFASGGGAPEIYSYGHRNPQGMAVNPWTGAVWLHEHGARGGDEVNHVLPGRNYGWPVITHGVDYDGSKIGVGSAREGMEQPLWYWVPSIAPSGMAFYDGDAFPGWKGSLFVGALRGRLLARLELDDGRRIVGEERLLAGLGERIRDVRQGPDGYIYLLTDESRGRILRLVPGG